MSIAVIYESMFGNTRKIALAIAEGLAPFGMVSTVNVNDPRARKAAHSANLLVLGGPTHVHGMSRPSSRQEALTWSSDPRRDLELEPLAPGTGVREWLRDTELIPPLSAAFDTRVDIAHLLSGAACGHIQHALAKRGSREVIAPESFLVTKDNILGVGELARARDWGTSVGRAMERFRDR